MTIIVQDRISFLEEVKKLLPENPDCAELGVYLGDFSNLMLESINPRTLVLVDPYEHSGEFYFNMAIPTAYSSEEDYNIVLDRFSKEINEGRVKVIKDYSYNAQSSFEFGSLDLLYVDASHLEDDVKEDLEDWLPIMKEGSIISGHDYADIPEFGVIEAVDWFMDKHGYEMVIYNRMGGDYALKKIK